jgi:hypothetical protein
MIKMFFSGLERWERKPLGRLAQDSQKGKIDDI